MDSDPKHHSLEVDSVVMHVDAWWLWRYAGDFLEALVSFRQPEGRFSPVPYYLACRSIELSLKAFLFPAGFKKRHRKQIGHNLQLALEKAESNGLGALLEVAPDDRELVRAATQLYQNKEFEYFESLETVYDPLTFDQKELESFARRLLEAVETPVRDSVIEQ